MEPNHNLLNEIDFSGTSDDELVERDMLSIINATVKQNGLVGHNINGFNDLINGGISRIMTDLFAGNKIINNTRNNTDEDKAIKSYQIQLKFHSVKIGKPVYSMFMTGQVADLYPGHARLTGIPYSGAITLGATINLRAHMESGDFDEKVIEIAPFQIGSFPIMVGSSHCHTSCCTAEALKEIQEDPMDTGGYFIAKRGEYVVDLLENIKFNYVHIHSLVGNGVPELIRAECLTKPGGTFENSSQVKIRLMENHQILIEINSVKFNKVRFPFFIIYRLLGMTSDKEIVKTIVFDLENKSAITKRILQFLEKSMLAGDDNFKPLINELDRSKLIQMTAERCNQTGNVTARNSLSNDLAFQATSEDLMRSLDKVVYSQMGQRSDSRILKLKYLGLAIHKMFLTLFGVIPPTDRDSYKNKRVHGSGVSDAKAFKTQVNNTTVQPIYMAIVKELKNNPWSAITQKGISSAVKLSVSASDLNRAMEQSITSGNKTIVIRKKSSSNRVSSQALERKNFLNTVSALRSVVTQNSGNASKTTSRADIMRRVHSTYTGFICVSQSADTGENVGMKKQLAITASVCTSVDTFQLKNYLLSDSNIIHLESITSEEMLRRNLAKVFINGEWIGFCDDPSELVTTYRLMRRSKKVVDKFTSISWDPVINEVDFWLDVGRLVRPLLIVYNNFEEYKNSVIAGKPIEFEQYIKFTKKHVAGINSGKLTLDDLIEEQIIEYITPEEHENCFIAHSIVKLKSAKNDPTQCFTHCDIEQAIFGLTSHLSMFGNHTQPARVTYETNQGRQTGGWYSLNFPFRADKNRFFQFYNEMPIVKTITQNFVMPNGVNTIVAYASYGGNNQEDSAIVSQASTDRGLFAGAFFKYEMCELERNETFCTPDPKKTKNMKPNATYEKLVNGFIRVGSIVRNGDALIGKVLKNVHSKTENDFHYIDKSLIYRTDEPALVEEVRELRGANDAMFALVKLRYERVLCSGDKISSRSGNKGIVASIIPQSDMPFTDSGLSPDMIINAHSFPTRMTIGQVIETTVSKICAKKGVVCDGTPFLPVDHYKIIEELLAEGFRYSGTERLYNGRTGEYFDSAIFIGPVFMQRLQKFVLDDEQCVPMTGPTDALTGQPMGGKHIRGGLRLGEMERWGFESHGAMFNMYEKTHTDSDGKVLYICRNCGNIAIYNQYKKIYLCTVCAEMADIVAVESTQSAKLLHEELAASNIKVSIGVKPREYDYSLDTAK